MMWKHKDTGAVLYVGNAATASSIKVLDSIKVRRIVFCQQGDGKCHFEGVKGFKYLKVARKQPCLALRSSPSIVPDWHVEVST
jgi:hypothetical protein